MFFFNFSLLMILLNLLNLSLQKVMKPQKLPLVCSKQGLKNIGKLMMWVEAI